MWVSPTLVLKIANVRNCVYLQKVYTQAFVDRNLRSLSFLPAAAAAATTHSTSYKLKTRFFAKIQDTSTFFTWLNNPVLYLPAFYTTSAVSPPTKPHSSPWPLWEHGVAWGPWGAEEGKLQEHDGWMGLRAWKKRSSLHVNISAVHGDVSFLAHFVSAHSYMSTGTHAERRWNWRVTWAKNANNQNPFRFKFSVIQDVYSWFLGWKHSTQQITCLLLLLHGGSETAIPTLLLLPREMNLTHHNPWDNMLIKTPRPPLSVLPLSIPALIAMASKTW